MEIDPTSFRVVRRIAVGAFPTALLFQGGALWVGFGRDATDVARVDPASGRIERIAVGVKAPSHFLATSNGIWLTNDGDALVHLDPATRTVLGTTHFGRTLVQPAVARDGTLWVPDKEVDTIFRVNPATGRVLDSFAGGNGAYNALRALWLDVGDELRGRGRVALYGCSHGSYSSVAASALSVAPLSGGCHRHGHVTNS